MRRVLIAAVMGLVELVELVAPTALVGACAGGEPAGPEVDALDGVAITALAPRTVVPGTTLVVTGGPFEAGDATLRLRGWAGDRAIDVALPATRVELAALTVALDGAAIDALGGDAALHASATVELAAGRQVFATAPLAVELAVRTRLIPAPTAIADGLGFVNDAIRVDGDGFLLGGAEGTTVARLTGCFTPAAGGACRPVAPIELPLAPATPHLRSQASFAFSPRIAGIQPGAFTGAIAIVNQQAGAPAIAAPAIAVAYELLATEVRAVDPPAASLGQYVIVHGGGFVGPEPGGEPTAVTELELAARFTPTAGDPVDLALTLIPEIVDGRRARYVINTDDALGHAIDLRRAAGQLTGTITPVVSYGRDRVRGRAQPVGFGIAPIKQVVALGFAPSYVEALRDFGLRAVDARIRAQILATCRAAYRGVNLELRVEPPSDFALYEAVALVGVDPNALGLFGYDNSPGKDTGNLRLYDRIGGVNAVTQQDGFPGFGGVFLRSLLGFSLHPGSLASSVAGADPVFDQIFDPLRPDRGGAPVTADDLAGELPVIAPDGAGCPARDRPRQIACAIHVLGHLVGDTLAHEVGHSLGLADPYGDALHDPGDAPDRLMDAGEARPFLERAALYGQGPAVFCDDEYAYLRQILPAPAPDPPIARPGCR